MMAVIQTFSGTVKIPPFSGRLLWRKDELRVLRKQGYGYGRHFLLSHLYMPVRFHLWNKTKQNPDLMLDEQHTRLSHFNHVIIKLPTAKHPFSPLSSPLTGEGLLVKNIYNTTNKTN